MELTDECHSGKAEWEYQTSQIEDEVMPQIEVGMEEDGMEEVEDKSFLEELGHLMQAEPDAQQTATTRPVNSPSKVDPKKAAAAASGSSFLEEQEVPPGGHTSFLEGLSSLMQAEPDAQTAVTQPAKSPSKVDPKNARKLMRTEPSGAFVEENVENDKEKNGAIAPH